MTTNAFDDDGAGGESSDGCNSNASSAATRSLGDPLSLPKQDSRRKKQQETPPRGKRKAGRVVVVVVARRK